MNKPYLLPINDIYFISDRIKEINSNYLLFYNTILKQYEVHDSSNRHSLCVTTKQYPSLSLIKKLHLTKRENAKNYLKIIEEENQKKLINEQSKLMDKTSMQLNEVIRYSNSLGSNNLSRKQIKHIIN